MNLARGYYCWHLAVQETLTLRKKVISIKLRIRQFLHKAKNRLLWIVKPSWNELKEEWKFRECKITVLGTFAVIITVALFVYGNYMLPFQPIYEYIFSSFISLIAIVPAVSLAVMEISSGYSNKLARIYRGSAYFWYLVFLYLVIILISGMGLLGLNQLLPMLDTITPILSSFGILYLIPFFFAMMGLLDSRRAVEKLGRNVEARTLIPVIETKNIGLVSPPEDPLFPLKDMCIKATKEDDLETLQIVLEEMLKRYARVLNSMEKLRPLKETTFQEVQSETIVTYRMTHIIEHFINHLRSIKDTALKEKNEQAICCDIDFFNRFAKEALNHRFIEANRGDNLSCFKWIYETYLLGEICLALYFWDGAASALRSLSDLSEASINLGYDSLQSGIAKYTLDLAKKSLQEPAPRHFLPNVAAHCMSDAARSRLVHGCYDIFSKRQIEDMNDFAISILKEVDYFHFGPVLSRCYEKLLAVTFFDIYCSIGKKPEEVAKAIWDAMPFKEGGLFPILTFLAQDRKMRKIRFFPDHYSPKAALHDLAIRGLKNAAKQAINCGKEGYVSEIGTTLHELSFVPFVFKDEVTIEEICDILSEIYESENNPENFQIEEIPKMIFAMGYACIRLGLYTTVNKMMSKLAALAVFAASTKNKPEQSMEIAALIGYLGAYAFEVKSTNSLTDALEIITRFEEDFARITNWPQLTHIDLLSKENEQRDFGLDLDGFHTVGWLFRLFSAIGIKFDTLKPLVNENALKQIAESLLSRNKQPM